MLKKKIFSYEFLKNIENNFLKDAEVFLLKNLNVLFIDLKLYLGLNTKSVTF